MIFYLHEQTHFLINKCKKSLSAKFQILDVTDCNLQ